MREGQDFWDGLMVNMGRIPSWGKHQVCSLSLFLVVIDKLRAQVRIVSNSALFPYIVLQAEVYPLLLIRGGRYKFHIRSYIVVLEDHDAIDKQSTTTTYLYGSSRGTDCRHSRGAAHTRKTTTTTTNDNSRDQRAHITNGSLVESRTERVLLHQVEEVVPHGPGLERFVCRAMQQLQPDLEERARQTASEFRREIRASLLWPDWIS